MLLAGKTSDPPALDYFGGRAQACAEEKRRGIPPRRAVDLDPGLVAADPTRATGFEQEEKRKQPEQSEARGGDDPRPTQQQNIFFAGDSMFSPF